MARTTLAVILLLAVGGCGGEDAGPPSAPTPGPTSISSDVVSTGVRAGNSFTVEFVSAQPRPGSSVAGHPSGASFAAEFKARLTVGNPSATDASGCNAWVVLQKDIGQCAQVMTASPFSLRHGESVQVEVGTPDSGYNAVNQCATPIDISSMVATTKCQVGPEAQWGFSGWFGGAQRTWSIHYRILP
jgi:hypothetical protein